MIQERRNLEDYDPMNLTSGVTKRNGIYVTLKNSCIVLRRLAYPSRWTEVEEMFVMRSYTLCEVFYECSWSLFEAHRHLVTSLCTAIMMERAPIYADAIHRRGGALDIFVGVIDWTKIRMCRPSSNGTIQRFVYSGYERMHCLIYKTLTTLDSLIFHSYGPVEGRRPD